MARIVDEEFKTAQTIRKHIGKIFWLMSSYPETVDLARMLAQAKLPPPIEAALLAEVSKQKAAIAASLRDGKLEEP